MIEVDKNIPVPKPRGKGRYPLRTMKVGESFFVPADDQQWTQNRLSSIAWAIKGKKYRTKRVTEKGVDGVRVWRTE